MTIERNQDVAIDEIGWWGRVGLWVARHVFRLKTISVARVANDDVCIEEGKGRKRDYILVGDLPAATPLRKDNRAEAATPSPVEDLIPQSGRDCDSPASGGNAEAKEADTCSTTSEGGFDTVPELVSSGPKDGDGDDQPSEVAPTGEWNDQGDAKKEVTETETSIVPGDHYETMVDTPDGLGEEETPRHETVVETSISLDTDKGELQSPEATSPTLQVGEKISAQEENDVVGNDNHSDQTPAVQEIRNEETSAETTFEETDAPVLNRAARRAKKAERRRALKPLRPISKAVQDTNDAAPEGEPASDSAQPREVGSAPSIDEATIEEGIIDVDIGADHETAIKAATPRQKRAMSHPAPEQVVGEGLQNVINMHDVLDRLPQYFEHLKMLKDIDEDSYSLFSTLGGQIALTDGDRLSIGGISPEFIANPPQVRCVFLHSKVDEDGVTEDDKVPASIVYMMRMAGGQICVNDQNLVVIPAEGLTYRYVTVLRYKGKPYVQTCFVHIDGEGCVRALPERQKVRQVIPGRHRENVPHAIRHSKVQVPSWIATAASDHKLDPETWLAQVVSLCASAKRPDDAILVRAYKGGIAAAWTINRRDAKRFFAARERDEDGRRRRVLHYVASFDRMTANGTQSVREHYRGAREFEWQGYQIQVSGLNFHHSDFFESNLVQHVDHGDGVMPMNMVSLKKVVGDVVARYQKPVYLSKRSKAA